MRTVRPKLVIEWLCDIGSASSIADLSQRGILIAFVFRSSKKLIMPHRPQARIAKQKLQLPTMRRRVFYEVRWKHWVFMVNAVAKSEPPQGAGHLN